MRQLKPTTTTALVLKGQQACDELGILLRLWESLVRPEDFQKFVFLLDAPKAAPPLGISATTQSSIQNSSFIQNGNSTQPPPNLVQAITERIVGGHFLVQAVITDFTDPDSTLDLLSNLSGRFGYGGNIILYLLLRDDDPDASPLQHQFLQALSARKQQPAGSIFFTYLLSRRAADHSMVSKSARWRALSYEVLAHSARMRTLSEKGLYSLGYSVVNADDSELVSLRQHRISDLLKERSEAEFRPEEAFRLLSLEAAVNPATHEQVPAELVRAWIQSIVNIYIQKPDRYESQNNRVLIRAGSLEPEALRQYIERFYAINWAEKDWSTFKKKYLADLKEALSRHPNAALFPRKMINRVEEHLKSLLNPMRVKPELPKKRLLELPAAYTQRLCQAIEKDCESQLLDRLNASCAQALIEVLADFKLYLDLLAQAYRQINLHSMDAAQSSRLASKFFPYEQAFLELDHIQENNLLPLDLIQNVAPYFTPEGSIRQEGWQSLIQRGAENLRQLLPGRMGRDFVSALNEMFTDVHELSGFFSEYLPVSQRMLHNVHDAAVARQSILFVDHAFGQHPLLTQAGHACIVGRTDNIERVDLYALIHDESWYLSDLTSPYFSSMPSPAFEAVNARRLFDEWAPQAEAVAVQAHISAQEEQSQQPSEEMSLRRSGRTYVLSWTWKPGTQNARVSIQAENQKALNYMLDSSTFGRSGGLVLNDNLPYGRLDITVSADGEAYASASLPGKTNLVKYKVEANAKGSSDLIAYGSVADIRQLVLCIPRADQQQALYYPINPKLDSDAQHFVGLHLTARSRVTMQAYPNNQYPSVEAQKV